MAIQLDLESSQYGISFADAYFRIIVATVARFENQGFVVRIDVVGYANKPSDIYIKDIAFKQFQTTIEDIEAQDGVEFLAKCYQWVMAQPDMLGSIAV